MADRNQAFYDNFPDSIPRTHLPRLARLARFIYNLMGWRFVGDPPDLSRAVVVLAPHTSNWDFFIAVVAKFALDLRASYVMKKEAFFWPFRTWLVNIGGIPIDRNKPSRMVSQVSKEFSCQDRIWLVITPEGTRKKVPRYKSGFARIAYAAKVPVVVVGLDYQRKAIVFSKVLEASGRHDQDANELQGFCQENFTGRRPHCQ